MKNDFAEEGILCDMHMHSHRSHDGKETVAAMAKAALDKKLAAICITDHCDIEYFDTVDLEKIARESFTETKAAALEFDGKLGVLSGIEIGEAIWHPEIADRIKALFPFDAILGSVHAARFPDYSMPYSTIDFSQMSDEQIKKYVDVYFDDLLFTAESFDFDILTHLTCPLRYICGKFSRTVDLSRYRAKIDLILKTIVRRSIALEVNTSSLGTPYDEFLPDEDILSRYCELGGKLITLASDAHVTGNIGHGFDRALGVLKKRGFDTVYYYENRKAIPCRLP